MTYTKFCKNCGRMVHSSQEMCRYCTKNVEISTNVGERWRHELEGILNRLADPDISGADFHVEREQAYRVFDGALEAQLDEVGSEVEELDYFWKSGKSDEPVLVKLNDVLALLQSKRGNK